MSNKVKVNLGAESYNILLEEDFMLSIKKHVKNVKSDCLVITQKNISNLFPEKFKALADIKNISIFYIEDGEQAKSIDSVMNICNAMSEKNFDRSSKILPLEVVLLVIFLVL